ncbi:MAG TPA: hypothetical protein VGQ48_04280 [Gemmatimonadales bacterium]|jgi:hypothetical protein|nr:hypothetical protein [Gemmatimonadales bacterium]
MGRVGSSGQFESVEFRGARAPSTDRADLLAALWSVRLPRLLDPYAPTLADAFADGVWTAAWHGVASWAPVAALIAGLLAPSLWPGLGADHLYVHSVPFLMLVIAAAILSGPVGVLLVLGYVLGDGFGTLTHRPVPPAVGLLVSYFLLALLAVRIPQLARQMAEDVAQRLPEDSRVLSVVRALLYAAGCGVLVYLWSQVASVSTLGLFAGLRDVAASLWVERGWLVVTAVIAAVARIVLEDIATRRSARAAAVTELQQRRWARIERRGKMLARLPAPARAGLMAGMMALLVAGMIRGVTDLLLVVLAVGALEVWRAKLGAGLPARWAGLMSRVPPLLRFAVALGVGFLLEAALAWPATLVAVLTFLVFGVLFPPASAAVGPWAGSDASRWWKVATATGLALAMTVLASSVALAAQGGGQCRAVWCPGAATGGTAGGALGASAGGGVGASDGDAMGPGDDEPDGDDPMDDPCKQGQQDGLP